MTASPHLLAPVVTDPKKSVVALKWVVREMENRYRSMSKLGVRNITGYNQRLEQARKRGEHIHRTVQTGFDPDTGKPVFEDQPLDLTPLPLIVVIVDEMADLMLVAGKDVEAAIQRLSQMARAAGIHLIMADAEALGRRRDRHYQGQFPDPHQLPGHVPRSTAARSSANRAPSNCWAWEICSTWPAAAASPVCTDRLSPTARSKRWSLT